MSLISERIKEVKNMSQRDYPNERIDELRSLAKEINKIIDKQRVYASSNYIYDLNRNLTDVQISVKQLKEELTEGVE